MDRLELITRDLREAPARERARELGVKSMPSLYLEGELLFPGPAAGLEDLEPVLRERLEAKK